MIPRRSVLGCGLALVFSSPGHTGRASVARLRVSGPLQQGSLVVGTAAAGAKVSINGAAVSVSPSGVFAFGLGYDQKTSSRILAQFSDGGRETLDVRPKVRKYDIQRINGLPESFVSPPPDIQKRIDRENSLIAEARKGDTAGNGFADPFDWPIAGIVSGLFGSQRILNGEPKAPHFGVDIAAQEGTAIHAPSDGKVSLAEPDFYLTGGTTVLDHGHGVFTMYIHQSAVKAKVGQQITRGDLIGLVGKKGRATGPHLHWGMNWFQMKLDPSLSTRTAAPPKA